jgi:hypothetical protein
MKGKGVHFSYPLHRLSNPVAYLTEAAPRRPLESRVREYRTHGLNGGFEKHAGVPPVVH